MALLLLTLFAANPTHALDSSEQECVDNGWTHVPAALPDGQNRQLFIKAPAGQWTRGVIVAMHGGGGRYTRYCKGTGPQHDFSNDAITRGFAVISLDSTGIASNPAVTDNGGLFCGKIWDDEVRSRDNLDLPFFDWLLNTYIPGQRPRGSSRGMFVTGHSSGSYMTTRASTHFDNQITAFAPVAGGDPYG
ncbi:MAG: hypothetical protein L0219_15745, partial [Phycisphaerales bacterium]|nr:hypothetical protein [Phycisphaerales bacterium]